MAYSFLLQVDEPLPRIDFPIILAFMTLLSLMGTSLIYNNHSKLVNGKGSRLATSSLAD
jgi:hypothetical protein